MEQSGGGVTAHGPIPQAHFLAGLGIEARLDSLTSAASPSQQEALISGFNRLLGGNEAPLQPAAPTPTDQESREGTAESLEAGDHGSAPEDRESLGGVAGGEVGGSSGGGISVKERFKDAPRPPSALDSEGMGFTYKAFAIASAETPPIPFPGSGVEFED